MYYITSSSFKDGIEQGIIQGSQLQNFLISLLQ